MLWTETFANAVKPRVDRFVVEDNRMVSFRFKFVAVKVLDDTTLPPCANRLLSCLPTREYLHVHHVMLLCSQLRIIIRTAVENQIAWFHLRLLQIDRQRVKLVTLVPSIELETEFFTQVVNCLSDECTAVEKERTVVVFFSWLPVSTSIRHTEVLLTSFYEFSA